MTITPKQCRAARELLGWKQEELQKRSKLGVETIGTFERGTANSTTRTLDDIRRAFESAGIEFVNDEAGEGVKLLNGKKPKKSKTK